MFGEELKRQQKQADDLPVPDAGECDPWDDWDDLEPGPRQNDIWDAFDLDDERDEPLPEYGDFWPEPDEDEV